MATVAFSNPALNQNVKLVGSPLARALVAAGTALAKWETRRRTRVHLRDIDPALYQDIGLSTAEVLIEIEKPFWRP